MDNISLCKSCDEMRPPLSRMCIMASVGESLCCVESTLWTVVQQSAELLLGRARLFVSPQQQQQAPTTEKLDTQTGREVIVFGFKK